MRSEVYGRRSCTSVLACAVVGMMGTASGSRAQEPAVHELPPVEVTTSSPVAKAKSRPKKNAPTGATTQTPPAAADQVAVPPGTVLDDHDFVAVTTVTDSEIATTNGPTITDTLANKPGIASTSFAPGANRPIIRGLDSYRIRTQENGIGTHDVAAISEDHAVPVDPNAADRVEVVRGPATLRYGSQAIGGVVAVENERIPTFAPKGGVSGAVRGGLTSVDEGEDGAFAVTAGTPNGIVVHADGFARSAEDYETPRGRELNSFVDSKGGAFGMSRVSNDGYIGVAFAHIESLYGIPGDEAREGVVPRIDMEQQKVLARGEWRVRDFGLEAVRFWFGASDYAHDELAIHDPAIETEFEVGSRFTNTEQEARVELQHLPVGTALGELTGAIGAQWGSRDTRGQSFEGESLLEPVTTDSVAAFWFEELSLTPSIKLQAAARIEHTAVDGSGWDAFTEDPGDPDHFLPSTFAGERSFTPSSASLGLLHALPFQTVARLTGQYVERAPDAAELFSKGMHEATGTFEVGNPFLDVERASTIEAGLKRATGAFRFDASAYYTRYDGFIYRQLTDRECDGAAEAGGEFHCETAGGAGGGGGHAHEAFDLVYFQQRDARFYGVEVAGQHDVAPIWNGIWGVDGQYDFVNAEFENGEKLPRIPPHRLGGGLYYRDANWSARVGVLHAFDQNRIGLEEIATPGYTLVSAEVTYTHQRADGGVSAPVYTIGLKGENLADDEVLNHASFKRREDVLGPGASVRLFGSVKLN
jgi:iron complex outermembrane recepter protein